MKLPIKTEEIKSDAVVLGSERYGEKDRIASLFTRASGKVKVMARGARTVTSRYGAGLLPPAHIEIQLARKKSDFFVITGYSPLDEYVDIKDKHSRLVPALKLLGIFSAVTPEHVRNEDEFILLLEMLGLFRLGEQEDSVRIYFIIRLLSLAGFGLDIRRCSSCGKKYPGGPAGISYRQGAVCRKCAASFPEAVTMTEPEISAFGEMSSGRYQLAGYGQEKFRKFSGLYLHYHLEKLPLSENIF